MWTKNYDFFFKLKIWFLEKKKLVLKWPRVFPAVAVTVAGVLEEEDKKVSSVHPGAARETGLFPQVPKSRGEASGRGARTSNPTFLVSS